MFSTIVTAVLAGYVQIGPSRCQADWLLRGDDGTQAVVTFVVECGAHRNSYE